MGRHVLSAQEMPLYLIYLEKFVWHALKNKLSIKQQENANTYPKIQIINQVKIMSLPLWNLFLNQTKIYQLAKHKLHISMELTVFLALFRANTGMSQSQNVDNAQ